MLDHILKFMTLGSVIIGAIAVYTALRTNNRRLGADIFLRYSDRISNLRRSLPATSFFDPSLFDEKETTPEVRRAAHEAIYSIFELYELKVQGFIPTPIWKIWEPDIERLLLLPILRQELAALKRGGFARHPRFNKWVETITLKTTSGRAF